MNIVVCEKIINPQELLPQIIERIFAICKNDSHFELKDELKEIENKIENINNKISKQKKLMEQSVNLKKDMLERISILDDQNEKKQMKLLDSIGE